MLTRRKFLKMSSIAGAGLLVRPWEIIDALAAAGSPNLTKWMDPLIVPPVLTPDTTTYPGIDYYQITMKGGTHQFHSQLLPAPTYAYDPMPYLGPTIEAKMGTPAKVKWINNLPLTHPVQQAIDPTVPDPAMYGTLPAGRAVAHLHGAFVPPQFDGHPHQWFTPSGQTGSHYVSDTYLYPNAQSAAPLWYHDHAFGITRLNVYAGLAALYLIRDTVDTGVVGLGLNIPKGVYEIPLVIQDRMFNPGGTLFYPTVGVTAVHPIWVPEFFGDTPVVNAKAYPYLNVARRRYRFRVYNGSQARFYNLWFDNGAPVPFYVIGMEGGFLPAPVLLNKLLLAPGERADIIFDFGGMPVGTVLTLKNNAKAPYPGGKAGGVPQIMQFRVTMGPPAGGDPTTPPAQLVLPPITPLNPVGAPMREVVLQENVDPATGNPLEALLNGKFFNAPVEETPKVGDTEVWQFINITGDAHPMHTHLVMFQVLNRQPLNAKAYDAAWRAYLAGGSKPILANYLVGPPVPPPPEESGWKDTAKAYPGEVLQVVAKFDLPPGVTAPADYVYHCHILEHEENEMMRPYQVIP